MPTIAGEELPDGDFHKFIATIRDDSDKPIHRATLTLQGERLG